MVSGLRTSPCDHERIFSGEASDTRNALKLRGFFGFSNNVKRSSIWFLRAQAPWLRGRLAARLIFEQLDVERQTLQFLHHDVERLGQTRLQDVFALHDGFVHPCPSSYVVRFDGQHLLQAERRAIRLEGPHFHFPKALATELRFAT